MTNETALSHSFVTTKAPAPAPTDAGGMNRRPTSGSGNETITPPSMQGTTPAETIAPLVVADKQTPGERLYKWVVHGGINTLLNETIGLAWMWAGEFGRNRNWAANKIWEATNLAKPGLSGWLQKAGVGGNAANPIASKTVDVFLLTMGGNSLLVPIKLIENHKLSWVKKADAFLDRLHGHKDLGVQEKAEREAAYSRIEHEKKPSWGRVLGARTSALAYNFLAFGLWEGLDKNPDPARRGSGRASNWVADKITRDVAPLGYKATRANLRWWINAAALETMSTINCSAAFFAKYELFDRRKEKKAAAQAATAGIADSGAATAGSNAGAPKSDGPADIIATVATNPAAQALREKPSDLIATVATNPAAHARHTGGGMQEESASNATSEQLARQAETNASPERAATPEERRFAANLAPKNKIQPRGETFSAAAQSEHLAEAGHAMGV